MSEPKYAVVRVDKSRFCPSILGEIDKDFICEPRIKKDENLRCETCRYGDTKQQLINKIAQVLIREVLVDIKIKVDKRTLEELTKMQRQSAEKIIDFLGVK